MDISGKTFDPRDNHGDLLIAQGKLTLDSEQNAAAEARDRRWRVQTMDMIGRAGYPAGLPESFRITLGGGGEVLIGVGRMYVDGLLAENHGLTAAQGGTVGFDAAHAELRSSTAVPFDQQPYLPGTAPPDPAAGDHLVYLDVWRREVNHLKDPSLVEPALGVDTAGRSQTVWQVRSLPVADGVTCATPDDEIADWAGLIAPSSIRLSSFLVPVSDPDNPCEIPPGQQLRTTENRTYRVETHGLAADGRALLKWSRVNASVATRVVSIDSATRITVAQVARDDVHRFVPGDWIELIDDRLEFAGQPGLMRMVATADPATNVLTFDGAIPAGTFPVDADGVPTPDLNLRIIRWDQGGVVRASGGAVLADLTDAAGPGVFPAPPPGEFVELEAGIAVGIGFAPGPQRVRVGDHWIFRARAATGTIDMLADAPPHGTHHHYARLAVLEGGAGGFAEPVEDCRDPIDPDEVCCCTFVIQPGEDIQQAIDGLPLAGGCICLKPGEHVLPRTLVLARSDVTLHGEARGVTLRAPPNEPALQLAGTLADPVSRIRIHTLAFVGEGAEGANNRLLGMDGVEDVTVSDCDFSALQVGIGTAIRISNANDVTVANCRISRALAGVVADENSGDIVVGDCVMALANARGQPALIGIGMADATGPITVRDCTIRGALAGVVVNDDPSAPPASLATNSRVTGCVIELADLPPGNAPPSLVFGIDMAPEYATVSGNAVTYGSAPRVGIRIAGAHSVASGNHCRYQSRPPGLSAVGIVLGATNPDGAAAARTDDVTVGGNTVEGPQSGIFGIAAAHCRIAGNRIDGGELGNTTLGIFLNGCDDMDVAGNTILGAAAAIGAVEGDRCRLRDNRIEGGGFGIVALRMEAPAITGNSLRDCGQGGVLIAATTERSLIDRNRVIRCGSAADQGLGIAAFLVLGEATITGNEVMDTGEGRNGSSSSATAIGILGDLILEALVQGNLVTYGGGQTRDAANEDRAMRLRGLLEASVNFGDRRLVLGFPVKILGNSFIGTGQTALVELLEQRLTDNLVIRFERVTFSDNYCLHFSPPPDDRRATVSLRGHRGVIVGNHIKSLAGQYFPVNLNGVTSTYLGNVAEAPPIQGATVPMPVANFNLDT
ncbi:DUF6519 domain-containing protein [Paracoccus siganidrum]|nr:DUF6519 domain-containing protein [Paracoccus siganidrum]